MPAPETSAVATASVSTTTTVPASTTTTGVDTGDVVGFDLVEVSLGGESLTLAHADEPSLRSRGLMQVVELGDLDGMLFSWGGNTVTSRFTMRNTLIPLRVVFFDEDGAFVSLADMVPCETDECPAYGAAGPYAYAVEFPFAREVSPDEILEIDASG